MLSEILYYFAGPDLDQVLDLAAAALRPGATLLAVHWRHPVAEHSRSGDNVHTALAARPELARLAGHTEQDFIAEIYLAGQGQPISVAAADGLVGGDGRSTGTRQDAATSQGEHGRLSGRGKPVSTAR